MTERRIYKEQPRLQAATNTALTNSKINSQQIARKKTKKKRTKNRKSEINMAVKNPAVRSLMKSVHPCIAQYCSALVDPRNTPEGACVPWGFPLPSYRVKVSARGTFQLGTTGQGFAYMAIPMSNDTGSIITTTVTSVGTNATAPNAFTNRTNNLLSKLPYNAAQLNAGNLTCRFVAGGIRIRYAGTEASRNGIVTSFEGQQLVPAVSPYTTWGGDINTRNERPPPDGSWHSCYYSGPQNSAMVNFTTSATWGANAPLIIYVQGVAADLYEWECYQHIEYQGDTVPGVTMTHSDPVGYAQVLEATKKTTTSEPVSDNNALSTFTEFMRNAGSSVFNYVKQQGMSMALESVSNYLLPGSGTAIGMGRKLLAYK